MATPQSVICLLPIDSEIAAPTEPGPGARHSVRLLFSLSRCVSASRSGGLPAGSPGRMALGESGRCDCRPCRGRGRRPARTDVGGPAARRYDEHLHQQVELAAHAADAGRERVWAAVECRFSRSSGCRACRSSSRADRCGSLVVRVGSCGSLARVNYAYALPAGARRRGAASAMFLSLSAVRSPSLGSPSCPRAQVCEARRDSSIQVVWCGVVRACFRRPTPPSVEQPDRRTCSRVLIAVKRIEVVSVFRTTG